MGIKNLMKLLKSVAPETNKKIELSKFSGKKFAIDTSIYMYRFMYSLKLNGIPDGSPLDGFIRQASTLINLGIVPLYVFDGKPPKEKKDTIKDRIEKKDKTVNKINELNSIKLSLTEKSIGEKSDSPIICTSGNSYSTVSEVQSQIKKLDKRVLDVNAEHFEECKKLFTLMGVPYITACGEAESLCARLVKEGYVDAAVSEDTDLYPSGSPVIIKDLNTDKSTASICYLKDILDKLDITQKQLIDICILCGCDYLNCNIRGIGPKRAYEFIKKYGTIEKIIEELCGEGKKYTVPDSFDYQTARNIFFESGCATDLTDLKVCMKTPDVGELMIFCNKFYLHKKWKNYLENSYFMKVQKLVKNKSLDDFFSSRTIHDKT
jgi:flap endonuclease-1